MTGRFLIDPVWWTFLFWLPDFFHTRYGYDLKNFGPPLVAIYILADVGAIVGGWYSSRLLKRGVETGAGAQAGDVRLRAVRPAGDVRRAGGQHLDRGGDDRSGLCRASGLFDQPLRAARRPVPALCAGHIDRAGRLCRGGRRVHRVQGAGRVARSVGSYQPFFIACGVAYLVALLVFHILNPRYRDVRIRPV